MELWPPRDARATGARRSLRARSQHSARRFRSALRTPIRARRRFGARRAASTRRRRRSQGSGPPKDSWLSSDASPFRGASGTAAIDNYPARLVDSSASLRSGPGARSRSRGGSLRIGRNRTLFAAIDIGQILVEALWRHPAKSPPLGPGYFLSSLGSSAKADGIEELTLPRPTFARQTFARQTFAKRHSRDMQRPGRSPTKRPPAGARAPIPTFATAARPTAARLTAARRTPLSPNLAPARPAALASLVALRSPAALDSVTAPPHDPVATPMDLCLHGSFARHG